jgi:class 3 adenylate cyclase
VDGFIFGAAVIGTLLAMRLLEQSRRRVFYQDIVITQQADALRLEKARADALLLNVLPGSISSRLLAGERTIADQYPAVTVLFADIVGFTPLVARLPADEVVGLLGRLFARFDELVAARGLEKIKTIGDAYMAAGGLPEPLDDHAARVVDLGLAMIDVAAQEGDRVDDLRLRVGVHSGPVIGGVIGNRKFAFDSWSRRASLAASTSAPRPGETWRTCSMRSPAVRSTFADTRPWRPTPSSGGAAETPMRASAQAVLGPNAPDLARADTARRNLAFREIGGV